MQSSRQQHVAHSVLKSRLHESLMQGFLSQGVPSNTEGEACRTAINRTSEAKKRSRIHGRRSLTEDYHFNVPLVLFTNCSILRRRGNQRQMKSQRIQTSDYIERNTSRNSTKKHAVGFLKMRAYSPTYDSTACNTQEGAKKGMWQSDFSFPFKGL